MLFIIDAFDRDNNRTTVEHHGTFLDACREAETLIRGGYVAVDIARPVLHADGTTSCIYVERYAPLARS